MRLRPLLLALAVLAAAASAAHAADIPLDATQPAAAVAVVERQARAGGPVDAFDHQQVHDLYNALTKDDALSLRLLDALASLNFAPPNPIADEDALWGAYADLLVKTGAPPARVLAALKRMVGVDAVVWAGLEPDKAPARRLDEAWFEPRAAALRALERADHLSAKMTDRLAVVRLRAEPLERLGRPADALALIDAALLRAQVSPRSFSDQDSALMDLRAERAIVLWQLGRFDEAIALDRELVTIARETKDYDGWADSMPVLHLDAAGRAGEALKALDWFVYRQGSSIDDWVAARSACVNQQLDRHKAVRRDLAELRADPDRTRPALTYALLCAGQLDAAAESYKARLADPATAPYAIQALSARGHAKILPPRTALLLDRQAEVAARPDVQAALVKAGGARRSPLVPSDIELW